MRINRIIQLLTIVIILLTTTTAHSILISSDWQTSGDGFIVVDTNTNLEWLNLTQSNGLSYSSVSSQFAVGGLFEGMRYATNAEVINLWSTNFGINLSSTYPFGEIAAFLDPGVRMASEALGTGISGGTDAYSGPNANYSLLGITGDSRSDNGEQFILGAATRWSDTDYYPARDPWFTDAFGFPLPTESMATGSYLVRASVPEPATLWLLGSGITLILGFRRKHR